MAGAAGNGSKSPAKSLFSTVQDAAPDVVEKQLDLAGARARAVNSLGQTLLFYAVKRQEDALPVCRLLLDKFGIQADHKDAHGQTALHYLATSSNVDCIDPLLERRCQINHVDTWHQTPLFYAAHKSGRAMVRKLIEARADTTFKDKGGRTPLGWAACPDSCRELALHCSTRGKAHDSKQAVAAAVLWHRQHHRPWLAKYLAACAEAWGIRIGVCWSVRADGDAVAAYVTSLARPKDVLQLCALEDEFITDHKELLVPTPTKAELFEQIGLNPDASQRGLTIRAIAHGEQQVDRQTTKKVRHYTLACTFLPENVKEDYGTARARSYQTVGYVYFKISDGSRDEKADDDSDAGSPLPKQRGGRRLTYLVISHVKVSRKHQKKGVATLLLASALRFAEGERPGGINCSGIHLSVAGCNGAAIGLYRKLGFVEWPNGSAPKGWISMRRNVPEPSLSDVSDQWLGSAWGGGESEDRGRKALAEGANIRRKRKLSPSWSTLSDASTSASGSSAASSTTSQLSSSTN